MPQCFYYSAHQPFASSDFFKKALIVLSAECPSEGATDKINSTRGSFARTNLFISLAANHVQKRFIVLG
jgi:hypothetical protein